jgi:hypothetical protein
MPRKATLCRRTTSKPGANSWRVGRHSERPAERHPAGCLFYVNTPQGHRRAFRQSLLLLTGALKSLTATGKSSYLFLLRLARSCLRWHRIFRLTLQEHIPQAQEGAFELAAVDNQVNEAMF